jgi:hypothetical protein
MPEAADKLKPAEIGKKEFGDLAKILKNRVNQKYNVVGWGGNVDDLIPLYPASAFAIVSDGITKYKRKEPTAHEDTDSLRELSAVLLKGSVIYGQTKEVDTIKIEEQIKGYIESHGGVFDKTIDWGGFIKERSVRIKEKADAIDEVNK